MWFVWKDFSRPILNNDILCQVCLRSQLVIVIMAFVRFELNWAFFVPVPSYLFSMGCVTVVANPIREYDQVDVTLYAVCCHPYHWIDQVRGLPNKNNNWYNRQSSYFASDLLWFTVHATAGYAFAGQASFELWCGPINWYFLRLVHCSTRVTKFRSQLRK